MLVTHEHRDQNVVEAVGGDPAVLRSTAGTHDTPLGEVVGVNSEHDDVAGTSRGPNTIWVLTLDGVRVAHFGDFGQAGLRDEQAAAIGQGRPAHRPRRRRPHGRTRRIGFLEPADAFLETFDVVRRAPEPSVETAALPTDARPVAVVPAVP